MGSSELDAYEELFGEIENVAETPPTSDFASFKDEPSEAAPTDSINLWPQKFGEVFLINNDLTIVCDTCNGKHYDLASFRAHIIQHDENTHFVYEEEEEQKVCVLESAASTEVDFEEFISTAAVIPESAQSLSECPEFDCEPEERLECSAEVEDDGIVMAIEEELLVVDEIDNEDLGEITELKIEAHPELADVLRKSNRAEQGTVSGEKKLPVKCEACMQNFYTNFERERHNCPGPEDAPPGCVCDACGKKFKSKSACRSHQKTHIARERYSCDQCENTYINKKTLIIHQRRHTGERPYACMYCTESFITSTALNRHLFKHTGRKTYQCTDCDQSFATSMQLLNHSRIVHLDLRRFQCSACGKTFRTSTHLKSHYDSLHANLPRDKACEYCGALFKTVAHLKAHMLVHEGKKYKCHLCPKAFAQYPGLYGHMKRHERPNATFGPGSRLRKMTANISKNKSNK